MLGARCRGPRAVLALLAATLLSCQRPATQAEPQSAGGPELAGQKEKDSYCIGYQFGGNLKKQPVDLDLEIVLAAIREAYRGQEARLSRAEMDGALKDMRKKVWVLQQRQYSERAAQNLAAGEAFLAANSKKEGTVTLPSGLQYRVLREGTGARPGVADSVTVHYRGTLLDGTEFDSSYERGQPEDLPVAGVIDGWTEALQLMGVGAKWQLFVPAKLAYGNRAFGRIPAGSTLLFELELLAVGAPGDAATTAR